MKDNVRYQGAPVLKAHGKSYFQLMKGNPYRGEQFFKYGTPQSTCKFPSIMLCMGNVIRKSYVKLDIKEVIPAKIKSLCACNCRYTTERYRLCIPNFIVTSSRHCHIPEMGLYDTV